MSSLEAWIYEMGLSLDGSATEALSSLPENHAYELLQTVKQKADSGHLKNPSNYVCATVARGYVPEANGGAQAWAQNQQDGMPPGEAGGLAERLTSCLGMRKAEEAGVSLTNEAFQALLKLPTPHASQLLEQVAGKKGVIRDLSNYVCATVARGFHPKAGSAGGAYGYRPGPPMAVPMRSVMPMGGAGYSMAMAAPKTANKGKGKGADLVPPDASTVEMAILDLNQKDLWQGQRLDANSLLALRCVPEEQAMDILGSLFSKGSGKGVIRNPNDYLQAAVAKIMRDGGSSGGGMNFTGNQTRQRAQQLGLYLEDETLQALAKMPLRASVKLLEGAVQAQSTGEDPNNFITMEVSPNKKQRIG